ncbi:DUF2232 domain-containing protein [Olsenella uli]|uniref:DUF2232 domain-containing protein n=1 Tax=Olsenella uli TaxID=133926 RepID=UPI00195EDE00|nr:DUF2232 domain-containing protein [Olsenella uli]MBM6676037.1 DUF2232 domain-containing protein [Olsenella uli]
MAGWTDNRRPPAPHGVAGAAREERGIVPRGQGGDERRSALSLPAGLFFCALGGAVASSTLSFVGPALVAYGYLLVAPEGGRRARLGCLAATLVPAVALGLATGVSTAASAVVASLVALAVCEMTASRRLTSGALCATVGLAAAALLASDELVALASGFTLSDGVRALLDAYRQQLAGMLVGAADQVDLVFAAVGLLWPVAYVLAALASCVSTLVGTAVAASRAGSPVERPLRLAEFDVPLWVVALLVASVAGIALAVSVDGTVSQVALAVSANVAMAVRFALTAQGLAVLAWLVRGKGLGTVASTLVGVVALYLEVQFVVLTVVGLVDVWANFRRLPRGARSAAADAGTTTKD